MVVMSTSGYIQFLFKLPWVEVLRKFAALYILFRSKTNSPLKGIITILGKHFHR